MTTREYRKDSCGAGIRKKALNTSSATRKWGILEQISYLLLACFLICKRKYITYITVL